MYIRVLLCLAVTLTLIGGGLRIATCAQDAATFPLTGKVLLPEGSPAAGAAVEARTIARGTDWSVAATATTGADGKFTMQLKPGDYYFSALLGSLVVFYQSETTNVADDGKVSRTVELRLEKGCKVEGMVLEEATGQPIEGVRIITRDGDTATSSAAGAWSMILPRESHTITAVKDGYNWPIVHFAASGDTAKVKVELKPSGTIKGKVTDEQGKPIANARVGTSNSGSFRLYQTTADDNGDYTLAGLDPDTQAALWASADGYERIYEHAVVFPAGKREAQMELTLKKRKARTISGRVTKPDGSPAAGAKVGYCLGTHWSGYNIVEADKGGNYEIKNADVNGAVLIAWCNDFAPVAKPVDADIDAKIDLQVRPGYTVPGCIEDEDGHPIEGAHVWAYMDVADPGAQDRVYEIAYTQTNKDGRFALLSMPKNQIYVSVAGKDYGRIENERLKVDGTDYTLVLRKTVPGRICGTVVKDSDGKPINEFNVRLDFSRAGGRSSGLSPGIVNEGLSVQAPDGRFTIGGLKPGDGYAVVINVPGYMEGTKDPVLVTPVANDTYKDNVIRLRPSQSFEGTVTSAETGAPLEGVFVRAWNYVGSGSSFDWGMANTSLRGVSTRTDAAGKFKFDSMPFSAGMLMLEKSGFARTTVKDVSFAKPLQTTLEKGATVTGTIADREGKVPPSNWLRLTHKDSFVFFTSSQSPVQPDGSFRVEDLPSGEYFIGQYKEGSATRYLVFELKSGETYQVDWGRENPVIVEGKVLKKGKPVPKAHINVNSSGSGYNWAGSADTADDGSFRLSLLKPGTYFFSCMLGEWTDPNRIYVGKTLALSAGKNQVDFSMPSGSISGKLVDGVTGKPLAGTSVRLYARETYEHKMGRESLSFAEVDGSWWPENQCKTDEDGAFRVQNLRAGKWMIAVDPGGVPAGIVTLADGEIKTGVIAKQPKTGAASLKIAGMNELPKGVWMTCTDQYGRTYYPKRVDNAWTMQFVDLPVGKLKATVHGSDYLPTQTEFTVRPDSTTIVPVKLIKGNKIVFKPVGSDDTFTVSIGFRITTPDGKPVYMGSDGLRWGAILTHDPQKSQSAAIAIKPGKYLIKAGAVPGDGRSFGDEPTLTGFSGMVTLTSGKDTIVEVPLNK